MPITRRKPTLREKILELFAVYGADPVIQEFEQARRDFSDAERVSQGHAEAPSCPDCFYSPSGVRLLLCQKCGVDTWVSPASAVRGTEGYKGGS